MNKSLYFVAIISLLFAACKSKKIPLEATLSEERNLDTLVISAPKTDSQKAPEDFELPVYNAEATKMYDLLHTKLDVRFDWEKQRVIGKATLRLKPYFYANRFLELDAKNFDINSVLDAKSKSPLQYEYDGYKLKIDLGREYTKDQELEVFVDYVAKPAERNEKGGSAAITSDQGLFFINHDNSDPTKPMQIWTQGETESNSRWFPTIDKPNERCTQELYITVQDKYKTLSNGIKQSSTKNSDGTRTDYWKMDLPHAPYLFMIGVGEFAVVEDKWNDMVVDYYVEPDYEEDARAIFANTLEMLDFFSEKTGYKYPWPKYSQIVVRDYVSGAMENTSAVIFGEFVQRHANELIDDNNDKIVAHEMFHHWFGDLVTCESWANLTLNEGFANYSEYLWLEHKYGKDEADYHRLTEMNGYIGESRQKIHPLIHFGYNDKEDMFDAHSYNKGGLVLHMLRNQIGDDAFWAGLNKYLMDNQYSDVEVDELRMAFEDVTGQDLNWFFNQWYLEPGHPDVTIDYSYDEENKQINVMMEQIQNPDRMPAIFEMPLAIDVYVGKASPRRYDVRMTERKQTFTFDVTEQPQLVNVDADRVLLWEVKDNKTEDQYVFQYFNAPQFMDRYEAMIALKDSPSESAQSVMRAALNDKFWAIRGAALNVSPVSAGLMPTYAKMVDDKHSEVRAAALGKLAESGDSSYLPAMKKALENDPSPMVQASGLMGVAAIDKAAAADYATKLEKSENGSIIAAISEIYTESGDPSKMEFFEKNASKTDGYDAISFMANYLFLAVNDSDPSIGRALSFLKEMAVDQAQSPWRRYGATKAMADLRTEYQGALASANDLDRNRYTQKVNQLNEIINMIKEKESNGQLKQIYQQL